MLRRQKTIAPRDALAGHTSGELQLIDVRESEELAEGFVRGATHVPLARLQERLAEVDRSRPVAFVCWSGRRSAMAAQAAAHHGLEAVNVKGGIQAWAREGLPLTTDPEEAA